MRHRYIHDLAATAALVAVAAVLSASAGCSQHAEPAHFVTTIDQLDAAYAANEVAADQAMRGHVIEVTGIVATIEKSMFGEPYLTFDHMATATLPRGSETSVAKIAKGQTVTLLCDSSVYTLRSAHLDDCRVKS